ncbi:MAG: LysM peptidoglycan-binding domain-containing protein [Anaerolineaceae bacterium]|nr:LysM peptidoglycan-binding domain-containing protein [Anaerolineaceae bacterium]
MIEKLYAAHVNYGHQLAASGNPSAAAAQFEMAIGLIPGRGEAELGLQSLLPPTATATPQVTIHIVQRGDTLYSIARRYGSTVDAVKAANGLTNNNIHPGQQLVIP